jgi:hypothetical protein
MFILAADMRSTAERNHSTVARSNNRRGIA